MFIIFFFTAVPALIALARSAMPVSTLGFSGNSPDMASCTAVLHPSGSFGSYGRDLP